MKWKCNGKSFASHFYSAFHSTNQAKNEIGDNKLIFANKTRDDIILKYEFNYVLGKNLINILSEQEAEHYSHGYITENFLKAHIAEFNKNIYVCGPPA